MVKTSDLIPPKPLPAPEPTRADNASRWTRDRNILGPVIGFSEQVGNAVGLVGGIVGILGGIMGIVAFVRG